MHPMEWVEEGKDKGQLHDFLERKINHYVLALEAVEVLGVVVQEQDVVGLKEEMRA